MKVMPLLNPAVAIAAAFASQLLTPAPLLAAQLQLEMYNNAADIPQRAFENHESIYGRVVKVADGDTIRIRHYPMYPAQQESEFKGSLKDNTISIRLYGIDAPELKKNANDYPSMPFAEEAKARMSDQAKEKVVGVKLLDKDQYGRVVGKVTTTNTRTDLSMDLLRYGYASLYKGKGADYDGNLDQMLNEINNAKKNRLGIWSNGVENAQSPAEYKRKMKAKAREQAAAAAVSSSFVPTDLFQIAK